MGDVKGNAILGKLRKNIFVIGFAVLAIALIIAASVGVYYYDLSKDRATQLTQKQSDYTALNNTYGALYNSYSALVTSDNDLNERFTNLTNSYDSLSSNVSSSESAYDALNTSVSKFEETGGPAIAVYYRTYNSGTPANPNFTVNITAYNVGDETDSQFTINCKVIFDGTPSVDQQVVDNLAPLDKKSITWVYTPGTIVDTIWVD